MNDQAKPPVVAGKGMAAIVPQDVDQTFRLATALASSGDMVPRHFQNKPNEVMAAIMRGMEIGLAPMQALSNIAVINGRASLWGEALPALMQRAGHHLDVEIIGDGDDTKAVATLTRGDTGKTITREFSVTDAKKAGLWGKQGPWQTYPKRMLSMRARAWAVRDGAADALMGLRVAEEEQDAPKDVTPQEPLEDRRNLAQQIMGEDTPEPATAAPEPSDGAVEDAEVAPTQAEVMEKIDAAETEDDLKAVAEIVKALADDEKDAARSRYKSKLELLRSPKPSKAYLEGIAAFGGGKQDTDCPHKQGTVEFNDWTAGWFDAEQKSRETDE